MCVHSSFYTDTKQKYAFNNKNAEYAVFGKKLHRCAERTKIARRRPRTGVAGGGAAWGGGALQDVISHSGFSLRAARLATDSARRALFFAITLRTWRAGSATSSSHHDLNRLAGA